MNREAFEKVFPVLEGVEWFELSQCYIEADNYNPDVWHAAREQDCRLRGWQAAKADSAAQVEALQRELDELKALRRWEIKSVIQPLIDIAREFREPKP